MSDFVGWIRSWVGLSPKGKGRDPRLELRELELAAIGYRRKAFDLQQSRDHALATARHHLRTGDKVMAQRHVENARVAMIGVARLDRRMHAIQTQINLINVEKLDLKAHEALQNAPTGNGGPGNMAATRAGLAESRERQLEADRFFATLQEQQLEGASDEEMTGPTVAEMMAHLANEVAAEVSGETDRVVDLSAEVAAGRSRLKNLLDGGN